MSNEVIIEEYSNPPTGRNIPSQWTTTQIKDIGTAITLASSTKFIRIIAKDTGFWFSFNNNAAANTAGSSYIPAGTFRDYEVSNSGQLMDTAS